MFLGALGFVGLLFAAACTPTAFPSGSKITASPLPGLIKISWNAASGVARYQIAVNNTSIANVNAPTTNCVLTGMTPGKTFSIKVTAFKSGGAQAGSLSKSYTTPASHVNVGTTKSCVPSTDSDGDRLPNAVETNNGSFQNAGKTGTNPNKADTDGDAIKDGDEVLGTTKGLDLPGMGTKPTHKNILFEHDWMTDSQECGTHSHRPSSAIISRLNAAFAAGAISNPDGVKGVTVINDYGQGGVFTGGNKVADSDGNVVGDIFGSEFRQRKNANFASNRNGYFHYVLHMHRYAGGTTNSSGVAELPGDDLIVSLQCGFNNTAAVSNTIMHEGGHNLNLRHGGNENTNYKPNYNSIMNYQFQFPGVDTNCDALGNGKLDYSRGTNPSLNENSIYEPYGVCGPGHPIDWSGDGIIDFNNTYFGDLNQDGARSVLTDSNDWNRISFTGINDANAPSRSKPQVVHEQDTPASVRG
jgi:hypothetical protein